MKNQLRCSLLVALLLAVLIVSTLAAFGLGAVAGMFRPQLARPFSDWALALVLPLRQAYCDVDDVTTCGVSNAKRQENQLFRGLWKILLRS